MGGAGGKIGAGVVTMFDHLTIGVAELSRATCFYDIALKPLGGRDNGAPGFRPEYHAGYYGAFALDPDGHNIEAVHGNS